MARGNQREKAREKNLKAQGNTGKKTNMTGSEFQKNKDDVAAIMRAKQAAAEAKKNGEGDSAAKKK
ncbi:4F5 domain protein [Aulographum hederae CBS 113979]|uniref:4F5 domain protein n=1 Tax=Aulographum hederae CBS 113979 TaxID=1176131 RepID=A0A6G1H0S3_9PEZI|nr:4F5 domain protein [Aulographum hederae CBS 113979]